MRLIHLGQVHKAPDATIRDENEYIEILTSQLNIARLIKNALDEDPDTPIFLEGTGENFLERFSKEIVDLSPSTAKVRRSFSSGFPFGEFDSVVVGPDGGADLHLNNSLSYKLTKEQATLILGNGAIRILCFLGVIPTSLLHITESDASQVSLIEKMSKNTHFAFVSGDREIEALRCISTLINASPREKIILILGQNHDLRQDCEFYGFTYEKLNVLDVETPEQKITTIGRQRLTDAYKKKHYDRLKQEQIPHIASSISNFARDRYQNAIEDVSDTTSQMSSAVSSVKLGSNESI